MYLEFKLGEHHAACSDTVDINLLIPLESKDVEGFVHDLHFFLIVDRVNLHLAQAARWVICKKSGVSKFLKKSLTGRVI